MHPAATCPQVITADFNWKTSTLRMLWKVYEWRYAVCTFSCFPHVKWFSLNAAGICKPTSQFTVKETTTFSIIYTQKKSITLRKVQSNYQLIQMNTQELCFVHHVVKHITNKCNNVLSVTTHVHGYVIFYTTKCSGPCGHHQLHEVTKLL